MLLLRGFAGSGKNWLLGLGVAFAFYMVPAFCGRDESTFSARLNALITVAQTYTHRMEYAAMSRRSLMLSSTVTGLGWILPGFGRFNTAEQIVADHPNVFGPRPGFTPQIGTFLSELTWMRDAVIGPVRKLTQAQLDWLFDKDANSIGALLLHLAATERFYQLNTFDGVPWGSWKVDIEREWGAASNLGDAGRATIKGHPIKFYLDTLAEVRARTIAEFGKRSDDWMMTVDRAWSWGPTNNLCKWFHVCEHESHHLGQIELLIKRTPGYVAPSR